MNIYFSGLNGVGIGPLAEIARDAGHQVQGSELYAGLVTDQLQENGVVLHIGLQDGSFLKERHALAPIDWFVYTAALPADHPELLLARELGIHVAKRDELLAKIIDDTGLKLIAVTGTHGKTTTTAMLVWVFQQLGLPVSYSIGSTTSFGPSGKFNPQSEFFIYECDEYDKNFLHFHPFLSLITSLDYDHPDTYPTKELYNQAFEQFITQSAHVIAWREVASELSLSDEKALVVKDEDIIEVRLPGLHNRKNATLVAKTMDFLRLGSLSETRSLLEAFPGTSRRFEKLADNLYTDYGHHPIELAATIQLANELTDHLVVVYQPHQNIRQHQVHKDYTTQFDTVDEIYWVPTYLTREDPSLPILGFDELTHDITNKAALHAANLDDDLWTIIQKARKDNKLVLLMGAGTIDSWVRSQLASTTPYAK